MCDEEDPKPSRRGGRSGGRRRRKKVGSGGSSTGALTSSPPKRDRSPSGGEEVRRTRPTRLAWFATKSWDANFDKSKLSGDMDKSIRQTFAGIPNLIAYGMDGSQSATTTVGETSYKTTDQMHSEMCAIQATPALRPLSNDSATASNPGGVVFRTTEPHCGYCTFFLKKLGLPLSRPTRGLFNMAVNCLYPLPNGLRDNKAFMASAFGLSEARLLDKINDIYVRSGKVGWEQVMANTDVLRDLWRRFYVRLNAVLPTR